jgi:hypothetical protein
MSNKHTQGEWKVRKVSDAEFSYQIELSLKDKDAIACIYGLTTPDEESQANAKLIAAAPTMYEFLFKRSNEGDMDAKQLLENLKLL